MELDLGCDFEVFDNFVSVTIQHAEGDPVTATNAIASDPRAFQLDALRDEHGPGKRFRNYSLPSIQLGDFEPAEGDRLDAEGKLWCVVNVALHTFSSRWKVTAMYPDPEEE